VEQDAAASGETTTDVVHEFFEEQGRQVSAGFLRHFRQDIGYSLHRQAARSAAEIEGEEEIEKAIRELWDWLEIRRKAGLDLSHIVTFDEKPVFVECFRRLIWRRKHSGPASVLSHGKTRQRETVILPSDSTGRKFPIIWIFHGKYQKRVKVPARYPSLVIFTNSANMNGQAMVHVLKRAIFPNLLPGLNVMLLDAFPAPHASASRRD